MKKKYTAILLITATMILTTACGCGNDTASETVSFSEKIETGISEIKEPEINVSKEEETVIIPEIETEELAEDEKLLELAFEAIDDVVSSDVEEGFTSAQMAVMKDGRLIYSKAWGLVNSYDSDGQRTTLGKEADEYTLYDLASNTKMYSVIYAVQLLVTRGELDLDEKIVNILGDDFSQKVLDLSYDEGTKVDVETQRRWKAEITVKDVLCHRAGFPDSIHYYDPHFDVSKLESREDGVNVLYQGENATREDVLDEIKKTPLMYLPHGAPVYSDIDYMLMTFVLEKITGMSLDDFMNTNFYTPMGLSYITYNPLEHGYDKENIAATELHGNTRDGYVYFPGVREYTLQGEVHDECAYYAMQGVSGHAGLFSNAVDLAKLCSVMVDGTYEGKVYFSEEVLQEFTGVMDDTYDGWGIGWWRHGESGAREYYFSADSSYNTVGHQGWTGTLTMIDRENGLVLVLLTNKINSPVTDGNSDPNMFDGKWFTTSELGFASKLIYSAFLSSDSEDAEVKIEACLDEFINTRKNKADRYAGQESHPAYSAYLAAINAKEKFIQ